MRFLFIAVTSSLAIASCATPGKPPQAAFDGQSVSLVYFADIHAQMESHPELFWENELEHVYASEPDKLFGGWLPRPSGLALQFKARAPRGERIVALEVHGKPVQDDAIYTVAACEREGDHEDTLCRIPHVSEPKVLDLDAHQAVRRYLARHSPLTEPTMGRVVAVDLPANMHSQFFGVLEQARPVNPLPAHRL